MKDYYQLALNFVNKTNQAVFITGKAGTGKTTLLRELKESTNKQIAVVAPTGIAAINASGTTIHSFFQIPFAPFIPTDIGRKDFLNKMRIKKQQQNILRELELLVIDEISMVRADVLDAIDTVLRHYRHKPNQPFGGVQVVFIGDMFQLSPVAKNEDLQLLINYYKSIYFFNSHVVQQLNLTYIELDKVFRQQNIHFINILDQVRLNELTKESMQKLLSVYHPNFIPANEDDSYITLTTHNYKADKINAEKLKEIDSPSFWFSATTKGSFPTNNLPVDEELELKVGAKVMFVKNDIEYPRRFYNGKIGEVTFIDSEYVLVQCPEDKEPISVSAMIWENVSYNVDEETAQLKMNINGSFRQIPLRHAWAITIHKSQGLTFDKAIIDVGDAFAPGQVYVALSRCRTLEGIVLKSKIDRESIYNDSEILAFSKHKTEASQLSNSLKEAQKQYRKQLLFDLYDFEQPLNIAKKMIYDVKKPKASFNDETLPHLNTLKNNLLEINKIAHKFKIQLDTIFNSNTINNTFLQERLKASSHYFSKNILEILESIEKSPAYNDNKTQAQTYNDDLLNIYSILSKKSGIISHLHKEFTVENYFKWRNSLNIALPDLETYGADKLENLASIHPDLMYNLSQIRNQLAEENSVPPYVVARTRSLRELADYLPLTPRDFLLIYGFGKVRIEKYGNYFLDEIRRYCEENGLATRIDKIEATPKKEKTKKKVSKGDSRKESLQLYLLGKSLEEIAQTREVKENTIASHLSEYIKSGEVKIEDFIAKDRRAKAQLLITENPNEPIYRILSSIFNNAELKLFTTWYRLQDKKLKIEKQ